MDGIAYGAFPYPYALLAVLFERRRIGPYTGQNVAQIHLCWFDNHASSSGSLMRCGRNTERLSAMKPSWKCVRAIAAQRRSYAG